MHGAYIRGTVALSIAMIASSAAGQATSEPLPEASQSTVGYESVAEALKVLRSESGVVFTTENGWLIATDEAAYTIWSFAPQDYPAYPAVVKRQVVARGSGSSIHMNILCEASKIACDDLVRTFSEMTGMATGH
jgi:hypothetical protein